MGASSCSRAAPPAFGLWELGSRRWAFLLHLHSPTQRLLSAHHRRSNGIGGISGVGQAGDYLCLPLSPLQQAQTSNRHFQDPWNLFSTSRCSWAKLAPMNRTRKASREAYGFPAPSRGRQFLPFQKPKGWVANPGSPLLSQHTPSLYLHGQPGEELSWRQLQTKGFATKLIL